MFQLKASMYLKNSIFWDITQKAELFSTTAVGISNPETIYLIGIYKTYH
jgi:hypothetical protein